MHDSYDKSILRKSISCWEMGCMCQTRVHIMTRSLVNFLIGSDYIQNFRVIIFKIFACFWIYWGRICFGSDARNAAILVKKETYLVTFEIFVKIRTVFICPEWLYIQNFCMFFNLRRAYTGIYILVPMLEILLFWLKKRTGSLSFGWKRDLSGSTIPHTSIIFHHHPATNPLIIISYPSSTHR